MGTQRATFESPPAVKAGPWKRRARVALCLSLLVAGGFRASASDQAAGGAYRIDPSAVANGGGTLSGGAFQLRGTLGQAQASTSTDARYRLHGGYWAPASDVIFASNFDG